MIQNGEIGYQPCTSHTPSKHCSISCKCSLGLKKTISNNCHKQCYDWSLNYEDSYLWNEFDYEIMKVYPVVQVLIDTF